MVKPSADQPRSAAPESRAVSVHDAGHRHRRLPQVAPVFESTIRQRLVSETSTATSGEVNPQVTVEMNRGSCRHSASIFHAGGTRSTDTYGTRQVLPDLRAQQYVQVILPVAPQFAAIAAMSLSTSAPTTVGSFRSVRRAYEDESGRCQVNRFGPLPAVTMRSPWRGLCARRRESIDSVRGRRRRSGHDRPRVPGNRAAFQDSLRGLGLVCDGDRRRLHRASACCTRASRIRSRFSRPARRGPWHVADAVWFHSSSISTPSSA